MADKAPAPLTDEANFVTKADGWYGGTNRRVGVKLLGRRLRQQQSEEEGTNQNHSRERMIIMREREPPFDPLGQLYIGGEGAAI